MSDFANILKAFVGTNYLSLAYGFQQAGIGVCIKEKNSMREIALLFYGNPFFNFFGGSFLSWCKDGVITQLVN